MSGSSDDYKDIVEYLRGRCDKLCLIYCKHVCSIIEALLMPQSVGQWNQDYNLFLNQFANATGMCIIQNVVIDLVYNALMLNLNSDQSYKPTNVRSNVKRSTFRYDRCSSVGGSNPMRFNIHTRSKNFL